ncbi:hypothetical protein EXM63_11855 [Clostridium botulinum]|uniref:Uncharacterized protein n=1 Tax=Clostridium botulinum TaxID=1491 RepID=A0A6M0T2G8_CLOBO|nr:hypothetical protein [Clostridium botulinum]NFI75080.1 hypothetical protein [Clostridium sporogenes]NFL72016.1 hypothetical protein [Clostridium sporogenes]NFM25048.1 hypothetical protein [Clostridium sporogenes]NFP63273.1 hypothetical protein [Clostridium sporogenes]
MFVYFFLILFLQTYFYKPPFLFILFLVYNVILKYIYYYYKYVLICIIVSKNIYCIDKQISKL